jgi:ATP-dependent Lhr-like helicase
VSGHDAFELLAPPIQRVLWDMKWPSLRPIQEEAIRLLQGTEADLVISAQTAAGKTEAAFLPILSRLFESPAPSVQALYVGPLKALINDQFRRLERLCERAEIAVHRWHGDVDAGKKKALLSRPSGVLLITPESIESLFINRSTSLSRLFGSLQYVVIDEVHALVGSERGTHLRSLLHRLEEHVHGRFRFVGLSATLGDAFPVYQRWLRPDGDGETLLVQAPSGEKRLLYKVHAYSLTRPKQDEEEAESGPPPAMTSDLYEHFAGTKGLVFANRKADLEQLADALNSRCRSEGRPEEFLVHHGSLSKEVREFTEQEMQSDRTRTTLCSSTLELGIDIGSVVAVGQVDPPWSVSSLVQRLGRSGRGEGEPQCLRMYVREDEVTADSTLIDRLYPALLRAIALTELMLQDPPWVEPPDLATHDLSTLTHQLLSVLAETGGRRADQLYNTLCQRGAFRSIDQGLFTGVLRSLGDRELIEQMEGGDLILAPKGERITGHYSFYSAFAASDDYSVYFGSSLVGCLPASDLPRLGDFFLLAGRRWQAVAVEDDRRAIVVRPAKGKKPPLFASGGGEVHPRVREMMREVLLGDRPCHYVNATGARLLNSARRTAHEAGIGAHSLVPLSSNSCLWFTWTGTKTQRTLCLIADSLGLSPADHKVAIELSVSVDDATRRLSKVDVSQIDATQLAARVTAKQVRKLDLYLDDELLIEALSHDALDVRSALILVSELGSCLKRQ